MSRGPEFGSGVNVFVVFITCLKIFGIVYPLLLLLLSYRIVFGVSFIKNPNKLQFVRIFISILEILLEDYFVN